MNALEPIVAAQVASQIVGGLPTHSGRNLVPDEKILRANAARHTYKNTTPFDEVSIKELRQLQRGRSSAYSSTPSLHGWAAPATTNTPPPDAARAELLHDAGTLNMLQRAEALRHKKSTTTGPDGCSGINAKRCADAKMSIPEFYDIAKSIREARPHIPDVRPQARVLMIGNGPPLLSSCQLETFLGYSPAQRDSAGNTLLTANEYNKFLEYGLGTAFTPNSSRGSQQVTLPLKIRSCFARNLLDPKRIEIARQHADISALDIVPCSGDVKLLISGTQEKVDIASIALDVISRMDASIDVGAVRDAVNNELDMLEAG